MIIQFKTGGFDNNFSYLAFDEITKEGFVLDPCGDTRVIENSIIANNVNVRYIINTHGHSDHTEGNEDILKIPNAKSAKLLVHKIESPISIKNAVLLNGGEVFYAGNEKIIIYHTPGHTEGSICVQFENGLFTGDTLFIDYCGFAVDKKKLYDSLQKIALNFNGDLIVYSGHDYGKTKFGTLINEKKNNPYLKIRDYNSFLLQYEKMD